MLCIALAISWPAAGACKGRWGLYATVGDLILRIMYEGGIDVLHEEEPLHFANDIEYVGHARADAPHDDYKLPQDVLPQEPAAHVHLYEGGGWMS